MVVENRTEESIKILLRPNHSATWKQTKLVLYGIAGVSIIIAAYWLTIGAWMVLPFIGLEILVLACLARLVCANSFCQDILTIEKGKLTVTYGKQSPEKHWAFSIPDTELIINRPHHSLSPHQLKLKDPFKTLIIGNYLNKPDIDQLINCLKQTQLSYRYSGQTKVESIDGFEL